MKIRSAYNFTNLDSFLKIYYEGSNVLITEEDFDLTWEYILRCQDNMFRFLIPSLICQEKVETVINGIDKVLKAKKDLVFPLK